MKIFSRKNNNISYNFHVVCALSTKYMCDTYVMMNLRRRIILDACLCPQWVHVGSFLQNYGDC